MDDSSTCRLFKYCNPQYHLRRYFSVLYTILLFVYFPVTAVAAADESDARHLRQVAFDGA